jgi:hypothetical protein
MRCPRATARCHRRSTWRRCSGCTTAAAVCGAGGGGVTARGLACLPLACLSGRQLSPAADASRRTPHRANVAPLRAPPGRHLPRPLPPALQPPDRAAAAGAQVRLRGPVRQRPHPRRRSCSRPAAAPRPIPPTLTGLATRRLPSLGSEALPLVESKVQLLSKLPLLTRAQLMERAARLGLVPPAPASASGAGAPRTDQPVVGAAPAWLRPTRPLPRPAPPGFPTPKPPTSPPPIPTVQASTSASCGCRAPSVRAARRRRRAPVRPGRRRSRAPTPRRPRQARRGTASARASGGGGCRSSTPRWARPSRPRPPPPTAPWTC